LYNVYQFYKQFVENLNNHNIDASSVQKMITNDNTVHVPARSYKDNLFFFQIIQCNAVIRVQEEQDTLASLLTNVESLRENLSSDAASGTVV
jgi:hypothetical protein